MDVDDRLQRLGVDVHTSLSGRMASGITINEPQSVGVTVTNTFHRSLMDVDGTGKGKRKVDDMPMLMHDGSMYFFVVFFPEGVCYLFSIAILTILQLVTLFINIR